MCARFKDPFKKSSFNFGMRMLDRFIIRPTLKLGSAAIKDLASSRNSTNKTYLSNSYTPTTSNQIKKTPSYIPTSQEKNREQTSIANNSHNSRVSIYSPNAQERIDRRKCGLNQCKDLSELIYKLSLDKSINPEVQSGISKIHVIINKYLDKGVLCGMDFYTFADNFCAKQIIELKTEKSKWEYGIARKILLVIQSGYSYEMIVQYLKTIN